MKSIKLKIILLVLLISNLFLICACDGGKSAEISTFAFKNIKTEYVTGESFDLQGGSIEFTYSNDSKITVSLKSSMIKSLPDMTTAGKKTIVIIYEGKEYSFTINVALSDEDLKNAMVEKLQTFLDDYRSAGGSVQLSSSAVVNIAAYFLDNEETINQILYDYDFDIPQELSQEQLFDEIYNIIIDAVINNSFDIDLSEIISAENFQAKFDYANAFYEMLNGISQAQFYTYLEDNDYIDVVNQNFCEMLKVNDNDGILEMREIISALLQNILSNNTVDYAAVLTDINNVIQEYTGMTEEQKEIISIAADSALSGDTAHILSNFYLSLADFIIVYNFNEEEVFDDEAKELAEDYIGEIVNIIRQLEDIELNNISKESISAAIENIMGYCENIFEIENTLYQEEWYIEGTYFFEEIYNCLTMADIALEQGITEALREFEILEQLLSEITIGRYSNNYYNKEIDDGYSEFYVYSGYAVVELEFYSFFDIYGNENIYNQYLCLSSDQYTAAELYSMITNCYDVYDLWHDEEYVYVFLYEGIEEDSLYYNNRATINIEGYFSDNTKIRVDVVYNDYYYDFLEENYCYNLYFDVENKLAPQAIENISTDLYSLFNGEEIDELEFIGYIFAELGYDISEYLEYYEQNGLINTLEYYQVAEYLIDNIFKDYYYRRKYIPSVSNIDFTSAEGFSEVVIPSGNVDFELSLGYINTVESDFIVIYADGYTAQDLLSMIYDDDENIESFECDGNYLYITPVYKSSRISIFINNYFSTDLKLYIQSVYDYDSFSNYFLDNLKWNLSAEIDYFGEYDYSNNKYSMVNEEDFDLSESFEQITVFAGEAEIRLNLSIDYDFEDFYFVMYADGYTAEQLKDLIYNDYNVKEYITEGNYLYVYGCYYDTIIYMYDNFESDLVLNIQAVYDIEYFNRMMDSSVYLNAEYSLTEEHVNTLSQYFYKAVKGEQIDSELYNDIVETAFIELVTKSIVTENFSGDVYFQSFEYEEIFINSGKSSVSLNIIYSDKADFVICAEGYSAEQLYNNISSYYGIKDFVYNDNDLYLYTYDNRSTLNIEFDFNNQNEVILNIQAANNYSGGDTYYLSYHIRYKLTDNVRELISNYVYQAIALTNDEDFLANYNSIMLNIYKEQVQQYIVNTLAYALDFAPQTAAYEELNNIAEGVLTDIIEQTFEMQTFAEELMEFIETHCDERTKTFAYSFAAMYVVIAQPEGIDYNDVFAFIELPDYIGSVDYNALIGSLFLEETYDVFSVSDVIIEYIEDNDGNITEEIIKIKFNVDFDIILTGVDGELELSFSIKF